MRIDPFTAMVLREDDALVDFIVEATVDDDGDVQKIEVYRPGSKAGPNLYSILSEDEQDQIHDAIKTAAEKQLDNENDKEADDGKYIDATD